MVSLFILLIDILWSVCYYINTLKNNSNRKEMKTLNEKRIKVSEIEEIKLQADIVCGLSNVFESYLSFTEEDDYLRAGMECLANEAYTLKYNCNALYYKLFPSKEIKVDN